MIVLLNKNSLTAKNKFRAEKMGLNLSERQSTATMTIGPQAPVITVGDWVMDEKAPGAGIVWRVKSIDQQYETDTRTLNLEHAINTLRDTVMFGDVTTKTLAGSNKATTCTALKALQYVIGKQSAWKLGTVDFTVSNPYSFNGEDIYSAVETISSTLEDCRWTFDFSSYPFTLNIKKRETAVGCEMRTDRNIKTLRKTIDRSRMYTRIYPIGQNNIHISGNYLSKNEGLYGTVSKVQTNNGIKTASELKAWAQHLLNRHCEPSVTVTISGLEMSAATGEPLDNLTIGKVCRVPLPEFSTTITERITKLSWSDKVSSPEEVTVTLANEVEDVTSIVSEIAKSSGRSGKASAKKEGEDHAWFVDTETHVGMVAEALAGEGADKDWSRVSSIMVDGNGITQQVKKVEEGVVSSESSIKVHENFINLTTKAIGKDGKVTAASICTAVNKAGSSVTIDADHIVLKGTKTTLESLFTVVSGNLVLKKNLYMNLSDSDHYIQTKSIRIVGASSSQGAEVFTVNAAALRYAVTKAETTSSGTNLKLTLFNGDVINFSKAVTSLNGTWSGGKLSITPVPQGSPTFKVTLHDQDASADEWIDIESTGTPTIMSGTSDRWLQADIQFVTRDAQGQPTNRGSAFSKGFNATAVCNAVKVSGPTWATSPSSSPSSNSNTAYFTTNAPSPSVSTPKSLYLVMDQGTFNSSGNKYVYVHHTDSTDGTRIARVQVSAGNLTVTDKIATYGNSYPTSVDGGDISKSGITAGKYMTMTVKMANKETVIRFHVVA